MAANANDYFQHVGEPGTATTLSAPGYTEGATTINVGSTTNFADDTGVIFAIDETETDDNGDEVRVQGTYNVYEGTVASGTGINNVSWLRGDGDRNYSAGASTRVYVTTSSAWADRLVDGMLVSHNQDGTLKDGVISGSKVADGTLPLEKIDEYAPWQTYASTVTGFSGTPTVVTRYMRIGKTAFIYADISGTSNATTLTFTVPYLPKFTADYAARVTNNGTLPTSPGMIDLPADTYQAGAYRDWVGNSWTASGTKSLRGVYFSYEINV